MAKRSYWIDLFTGATWQEFLAHGGRVSGFRESRWKTVQQLKIGDYLLCYLTGLSRFIGTLEVVSEAFMDEKPVWTREVFPARVKVKIVAKLTPETAVPILELKNRLTIFDGAKGPFSWTGHVRGSPAKWKESDGEAICEAVLAAVQNPVVRAVDPRKLNRQPVAEIPSEIGAVTIPQDEPTLQQLPEASDHMRIQWLLGKLGSDLGLDIWIAKNDRGKDVDGRRFTELPSLKSQLPMEFSDGVRKTIELIDVLWLQKHSIVAAFEIESTTQIYSGLLRMADLISMQPHLNIPLFIVAPEERREKVVAEVNRPTFAKLDPPMSEMCRFIGFQTLQDAVKDAGKWISHMKPEFLDELAEPCDG